MYLRAVDLADTEFETTTQNHIDDLCAWAHYFGMNFSSAKTKMLILRKRSTKIAFPFNFRINGHDIERVNEVKFLGLLIDDKLSFNNHVNFVINKVKRNISILKYMGSNKMGVKRDQLMNVMSAIVRSVLEYGGHILANLTKENKRKLKVAMNAALRACLGAKKSTSVESLYAESGYLSIEDRMQASRCVYILRLMGNSHHFLHGELQRISRRLREQGRESKYFNTSAGRAMWMIDFHRLTVRKTAPVFRHPIWLTNNITIDKELTAFRTGHFDNTRWRQWAKEKENEYANLI